MTPKVRLVYKLVSQGKLTLTLALAAGFLVPAAAQAQSFNCRYAKLPAEVAICQSPELRALDSKFARMYWEWRNGEQVNAPDLYQRRWLQQRNRCGYDDSCLRSMYKERIYDLENGTD